LILTLPAGVWADFGIRRLLMLSVNFLQSLVIALVPINLPGQVSPA
jgi:hypothetical protein